MRLLICTAFLFVLLGGFLFLYDSSEQTSTLVYHRYSQKFTVNQGLFYRPICNGFLISDIGGAMLHWKGKAYPLPSFTSATLTSAGFSHVPNKTLRYSVCQFSDGKHMIYLFHDTAWPAVSMSCRQPGEHTCPLSISMDHTPVLQFPATRADMEKAFGPPDDVDTYKEHPLLNGISDHFPFLAPLVRPHNIRPIRLSHPVSIPAASASD